MHAHKHTDAARKHIHTRAHTHTRTHSARTHGNGVYTHTGCARTRKSSPQHSLAAAAAARAHKTAFDGPQPRRSAAAASDEKRDARAPRAHVRARTRRHADIVSWTALTCVNVRRVTERAIGRGDRAPRNTTRRVRPIRCRVTYPHAGGTIV